MCKAMCSVSIIQVGTCTHTCMYFYIYEYVRIYVYAGMLQIYRCLLFVARFIRSGNFCTSSINKSSTDTHI
jgi:hypothetical protein